MFRTTTYPSLTVHFHDEKGERTGEAKFEDGLYEPSTKTEAAELRKLAKADPTLGLEEISTRTAHAEQDEEPVGDEPDSAASAAAVNQPVPVGPMTRADMEAEAARRGLEVQGTGRGGKVTDKNLRDALNASDAHTPNP